MDSAQILSWVVGAVGITGFLLAGHKVWWAWYVNIACQAFWIMYAIASNTPAFFVTALFYAAVFSWNAWKWSKDRKQKAFGTSGQFRKKPVVIDAMQVDFHDNITVSDIQRWSGDAVNFFNYDPETNHFYACKIKTLEGTMSALQGDWIIRGVNGEFYPCKPDIFEAKYEKVGGTLARVSEN